METAEIGTNRTGIEAAGRRGRAMLDATDQLSVVPDTDTRPIASLRARYAEEADPMGSVPAPPSVAGVVKAAANELLGRQPFQLQDKLGERLSFERTGARLYEALLGKLRHEGEPPGGPSVDEVERIVLQEYAHFRLLETMIQRMRGDPTVVTPSANLHATMTAGMLAVVVDPRTSVVQCLEAALLAELADHEGWETLHDLLIDAGQTEELDHVKKAIVDEIDHLTLVRRWLAAAQDREPPRLAR